MISILVPVYAYLLFVCNLKYIKDTNKGTIILLLLFFLKKLLRFNFSKEDNSKLNIHGKTY